MDDTWSIVEPLDRIRERKEPFRDGQGKVVPAGAVGKYFELQDQDGQWHPVDPANVRRYEKPESPRGLSADHNSLRRQSAATLAAMRGQDVVELRGVRGWFEMMPNLGGPIPAYRADAEGNFSFEIRISTYRWVPLHFASSDFSQESSRVIRPDFPDEPIEVTLNPARRVRARVTAKRSDVALEDVVRWQIERVDPGAAERDPSVVEAMDRQSGRLEALRADSPSCRSFSLDLRLRVGRYHLRFDSETQYRIVDLLVPPGRGPFDLPEIELKPFAWFKMLSKQAAEIEAVDLYGKSVTLAEFRDKVVVLVFCSTGSESFVPMLRYLADIQERFKRQSLAILSLHDASLESPEVLKKTLGAMPDKAVANRAMRILLDRAPIDTVARHDGLAAGALGSGRTADTYQNWADGAVFVIDKRGVLVFARAAGIGGSSEYSVGKDSRITNDSDLSLEAELEDLFGLPRSRVDEAKPAAEPPTSLPRAENGLTVFKGKVVDLDGKAVVGAKIAHGIRVRRKSLVESAANGEFILTSQEPTDSIHVFVEASGFVLREFVLLVGEEDKTYGEVYSTIDPSGVIRRPLRLGPGVEVTGRVLKDGKPVAGGVIGLKYVDFGSDPTPLESRETKVGGDGFFRLPHVAPAMDFWVYAKLGSLDGTDTVIPVRVRTTGDGSTLHVGDLHVLEGRTLSGRLVRSDGQAIPDGLFVQAYCANIIGRIDQKTDSAGHFEFKGLPDGSVSLFVYYENGQSHRLYRLSAKNRCLNPSFPCSIEGRLDHDVTDLTILLEPGAQPISNELREDVDPALIAEFNDAKAGPITGVPPRP